MPPLEPLEFPPPRPRPRFWHILLAGAGCLLLMVIAVGMWHLWRVRRQAQLVALVEQVGGSCTHYHRYKLLPDGDYEFVGPGQSFFPLQFERRHPDFCSQVFSATGRNLVVGVGSPRLDQAETEQFFRAVKGFPGLREVSIASDFFPGRRVCEMPSFRRLLVIDLEGDQVRDADVAELTQATELRGLGLTGSHLTDDALGPLARLPKLKWLRLESPLITDAGLAQLRVPQLVDLHLALPAVTDAGLGQLQWPAQLGSLYLNLPAVTDQGLCSIPQLANLQAIHLEMPVGDAGIVHLAAGGKLERITISQPRYGDAGLAAIAKNPAWHTHVDLKGSAVTDAGMRHLASLLFVEYVDLTGTRITDAGLAELGVVATLKQLTLAKTQVTGTGLVQLDALPYLQEIDLGDCPVSEEGLRALAGFEPLDYLKLAGTPITDEACALIPKWEGAFELDLSRTKLTDKCIPHLMPTTFHKVCLEGTGLTDAGLLAIAEDEGELAELSVKGTKVTAKGIVAFEEKVMARGRSCQLIHDVPDEELAAAYSAREAAEAAKAEVAPTSANPE